MPRVKVLKRFFSLFVTGEYQSHLLEHRLWHVRNISDQFPSLPWRYPQACPSTCKRYHPASQFVACPIYLFYLFIYFTCFIPFQPHNLLLVPFILFIYLFIYFIYLFLPTMESHWIHLLVCVASWQITQKVAKDNRLPWGIKYFVSLLSSQMETLGHH